MTTNNPAYYQMHNATLAENDPEVAAIIKKEEERQETGLEMIPSESFASKSVLEAFGSVFNNKYSEGYPHKRYYGGNENVDVLEELAISRAKKIFGAEHVNVQPYSGSPANLEVYNALLKPGDTILSMSLAHGGHLTHGHKVNASGKLYNIVSYSVRKNDQRIDIEEVSRLAKEHKPKLIIVGASAYPREIDFVPFKEIADEVGAYLMADIAHIAGLIAAGVHKSPFPHCDIVTTTTHKTLCGPRGAIIMCKVEDRLKEKYHPKSPYNLAQKIDRSVFPGMQGGPHNNQIAAKAVAFGQVLTPAYKMWAKQVVKNAQVLAASLEKEGVRLVSGGTDNHLILADVTPLGLGGADAETALDKAGITLNKNMIPYDERSPVDPSGIRMGTPALTNRGMGEREMERIGQLIAKVLKNYKNEEILTNVREEVRDMCKEFPLYE